MQMLPVIHTRYSCCILYAPSPPFGRTSPVNGGGKKSFPPLLAGEVASRVSGETEGGVSVVF